MEISFAQVWQIILTVAAILYHWYATMSKLKELEIRLVALEQRLNAVEKVDDKIMEKLEAISNQINELRIDLNNKQDKL